MSKTIKSEAIVLKKKHLLGKDYLVTILTISEGKIVATAKGIKKITSRRASHLQTGNLISVILSLYKERLYLQESKLISAFSKIKSSTEKIKKMYFMLFFVDRLLPENQVEEKLYAHVRNFLIELSEAHDLTKEKMLVYLNELLTVLGYQKEMRSLSETVAYLEEIIHEKAPSGII